MYPLWFLQVVRRQVLWPEETKDISGEMRTWVVNKHLGETVLHKAARTNCHVSTHHVKV